MVEPEVLKQHRPVESAVCAWAVWPINSTLIDRPGKPRLAIAAGRTIDAYIEVMVWTMPTPATI